MLVILILILVDLNKINDLTGGTGHRVIHPKLWTKHNCELQDSGVAVVIDTSK